MIHLQKTMCYDAWTQADSRTRSGGVTYSASVQLTRTRILRLRYTPTIGLLIVTLNVDVTTSPKPFLNYSHERIGHEWMHLFKKRHPS